MSFLVADNSQVGAKVNKRRLRRWFRIFRDRPNRGPLAISALVFLSMWVLAALLVRYIGSPPKERGEPADSDVLVGELADSAALPPDPIVTWLLMVGSADISVDGSLVGTAPLTKSVRPGSRVFAWVDDGRAICTDTVSLPEGATSRCYVCDSSTAEVSPC